MITFACPDCGQQLTVADSLAGRDCRCPKCQGVVRATLDGSAGTRNQSDGTAKKAAVLSVSGVEVPGYQILSELGKGGMGMVFKARHERLDRLVALKVIRPERLGDGDPLAIRRFRQEIRHASQLDHPHLIKVFDAGSADHVHYLTMELIDGIDLARLVKQEGPLPIDRAVRYLRQAAEGLAYAHGKGLVHRDIKPHNMLLDRRTDQIKILDLGLARMCSDMGVHQTSLTDIGALMGTLAYMAPEQGRDPKGVDGRADLYSLGCTAYHLLTGRPPFQADSGPALLLAHQIDPPEPLTARRPDAPPALAALTARLLSKKRDQRCATAAEVAAAVEAIERALAPIVADQPVARRAVVPPADTVPTVRPPRQQATPSLGRWLLAGAAALTLLLAVIGYGLFLGRPRPAGPTSALAHLGSNRTTLPEPRPFLKDKDKEYHTNTIGMHLVKVPKGTFWMGGGDGKPGDKQVTIEQDFYLGVFEVTQEQWQAVMKDQPPPSYFSPTGEGKETVKEFTGTELAQFPVEQISWEDCQEFIKRLNAKENAENEWLYRLPLEAEWEYACRGGVTSQEDCSFDYYTGHPTNDLSSQQANFNGNSPGGKAGKDQYLQRTTKVGSYQPNRLGIYDLHGNVWEWCQDLYAPQSSFRVYRGGGREHGASDCRAAYRGYSTPSSRSNDLGFRLARVPSRQDGK